MNNEAIAALVLGSMLKIAVAAQVISLVDDARNVTRFSKFDSSGGMYPTAIVVIEGCDEKGARARLGYVRDAIKVFGVGFKVNRHEWIGFTNDPFSQSYYRITGTVSYVEEA